MVRLPSISPLKNIYDCKDWAAMHSYITFEAGSGRKFFPFPVIFGRRKTGFQLREVGDRGFFNAPMNWKNLPSPNACHMFVFPSPCPCPCFSWPSPEIQNVKSTLYYVINCLVYMTLLKDVYFFYDHPMEIVIFFCDPPLIPYEPHPPNNKWRVPLFSLTCQTWNS